MYISKENDLINEQNTAHTKEKELLFKLKPNFWNAKFILKPIEKRAIGLYDLKNNSQFSLINLINKTQIFKNIYLNKNDTLNLLSFLNDFEKLDNFDILNLDFRSIDFKNFLRKYLENYKNDKNANSIHTGWVLVGFSNEKKIENWKTNGAAIFFDLHINSNDENEEIDYFFQISRIEFINVNKSKKPNIIQNVKFDWEDKQVEQHHSLFFIETFNKIKKLINWKDENFSNKLKIKEWEEFIGNVNLHFDKGNQNEISNFVFLVDKNSKNLNLLNLLEQDSKQHDYWIFSYIERTKGEIEKIKNLFLFSAKDFEDKVEVLINSDYKIFTNKKIQEKIENEEIKARNDEISEIEKQFDSLKNELFKINNDFNKQKNNLELKEKEFNFLNSEKEKQEKDKIEISREKREINNKLNNEITMLEKTLNSYEKDDQNKNIDINNQLLELKNTKNEYNSKVQKLEKELKNKLQILKNESIILEKYLDTKKNEVKKLENRIFHLENQQKELENKLKKIQEDISYWQKVKDFINECEFKQIYTGIQINIHIKENTKNEKNNNYKPSIPFNLPQNVIWDKSVLNTLPYLDTDKRGLIAKIRRYEGAFNNVKLGKYRNPYLVDSIFNFQELSSKNNIENSDLIYKIKNKYLLNPLQEESLKKFVLSQDTFYLQGPPGTGKTQTICSIAEYVLSNRENVLITSSTHEAIENFLDRLNEKNQLEPTMVLYKFSSLNTNHKKSQNFNLDNLYDNFVNKVFNFYFLEKDNKIGKVNNIFLNNKIKYEDFKNYFFLNEIKTYDDFKDKKDIYINTLKKTNIIDDKELDDLKKVNSNYFSYVWQSINSKIEKKIILINKQLKNINIETIDELSAIFKNKNNLYFDEYIKKIDTLNNENDNELNDQFVNYIFQNNLINVIGITTTSKTNIEIFAKGKLESRDLYVDYPIHTTIIDEISKSSTPEILSRIILAKKVVFSGDYKQLPPTSDLNENNLKELFFKLEKYDKKEIIENCENEVCENLDFINQQKLKDYRNKVENLYKTSFFKIKVEEMKKHWEIGNKTYQYLAEQHRFNEDIMGLVNLFYNDDEELRMPPDGKKEIYKFEGNKVYNSSIVLVNTSKFSDSYFKLLNSKNIQNLDNKFDVFDQQKTVIFAEINELKNNGAFNEYHAWVIEKTLNKFLKSNSYNYSFKNKIGIICLTRNQTYIVKERIEKNKKLKDLKIKIDTIDNFQGREKEVIIVDFVRSKNKFENNIIDKKDPFKRNISFLSEDERINVANSRAKDFIFLIGNFDYYKEFSEQNNMLNDTLLKKIVDTYIKSENIEDAGDWDE
ncbi:AAA domain-containing protein [Mesomycoplasma neurolyticum]|uniref:Putative DNA helicase n=1 Tax=Mesomycoplasma neurolyticum TaxID=2120 RepID=A0A449A562_9BACT|nr:AAA domain-containing protein [Mesomycoplasma neurolyticum]VEU59401.1 putative DNA helicase [Mesomycoplasma neurolyticum]